MVEHQAASSLDRDGELAADAGIELAPSLQVSRRATNSVKAAAKPLLWSWCVLLWRLWRSHKFWIVLAFLGGCLGAAVFQLTSATVTLSSAAAQGAAESILATTGTYVLAVSLVGNVMQGTMNTAAAIYQGVDVTIVDSKSRRTCAEGYSSSALLKWTVTEIDLFLGNSTTVAPTVEHVVYGAVWVAEYINTSQRNFVYTPYSMVVTEVSLFASVTTHGAIRVEVGMQVVEFNAFWVNPLWEAFGFPLPSSVLQDTALRLTPLPSSCQMQALVQARGTWYDFWRWVWYLGWSFFQDTRVKFG